MEKLEESHEIKEKARIWDCASPLYDSFELVAMNHVVEKHFMTFPYYRVTGSRNLNAHSSRFTSSSSSIEPDYAAQEMIGGEPSKAKKHRMTQFLSELEGEIWRNKNDGETIKERSAKEKKSLVFKIFGWGMSSWKK